MNKTHRNIDFDIVSISGFMLLSILHLVFFNIEFSLHSFSDLYLSQATSDGINVGKRIGFYHKALFFSIIMLPVFYMVINKFKSHFQLADKNLGTLSMIATTGLFFIIADIMGLVSTQTIRFFQLLFLLAVGFVSFSKIKGFSNFGSTKFFAIISSLALANLILLLLIFNTNIFIQEHLGLVFIAFTIVYSLAVWLINYASNISFSSIFNYALPLALIPLLVFMSIEILFLIKQSNNNYISYPLIFVRLFSAVIIGFGIYAYFKPFKINEKNLLSYIYIPSALLSFILLVFYFPFLKQSTEMFELANSANALMKIFEFGEIPFVQFFTSHMASDYSFGVLYNILFGYDGSLDYRVYNFMYMGLVLIIVYLFNLKVFRHPVVAILLIMCFPLFDILYYPSMIFSVLVFFAIRRLMTSQSMANYILFFALIVIMILWRLDMGAATLFSAAIFFLISFYVEGVKIDFKTLSKSKIIVFVGILVCIGIAIMMSSTSSLLSNFKSALHYATANQAHGYSQLSYNMDHSFYLIHFILPTSAVLILFYISYTLKISFTQISDRKKYILSASLFLYLIYLFNFPRGLVRHSFIEGTDSFIASTYYLATALFIFSFVKSKRLSIQYFAFYGISFFLIVGLKHFPISKDKTNMEKLLTENTLNGFDAYVQNEEATGRTIKVKGFKWDNYFHLKKFMDENIASDQTFLDFSNTPMLYYYCQRNVPGYFCQNLQNTVDDYLQLEHIKMLDPENVPVVVYSNDPPGWFDKTDGVHNTLRQYLIAEYIYKNYMPYKSMSKHQIWLSKSLMNRKNLSSNMASMPSPQIQEYKHAASAINHHFELSENKTALKLVKTVKTFETDSFYSIIKLDKIIKGKTNLFLKIKLSNITKQESASVEIMHMDLSLGSNTFIISPQESSYTTRISNHYEWHSGRINTLQIKIPKGVMLEHVEFWEDLRN